MKLVVVRHGETEENKKGIIQGHKPGRLSKKGKKQVNEVANKLTKERFDAIYSSDLDRCVETAKPIKEYHNSTPLYFDVAIRELSFGRLEGFPILLANLGKKIGAAFNLKAPGGESWKDLQERTRIFLNKLYKKYPEGQILIITHGGPMRAMHVLLRGAKVQDVINEDVVNCKIEKFTMKSQLR